MYGQSLQLSLTLQQTQENEQKQKAELEQLRKDFGNTKILDIGPKIISM